MNGRFARPCFALLLASLTGTACGDDDAGTTQSPTTAAPATTAGSATTEALGTTEAPATTAERSALADHVAVAYEHAADHRVRARGVTAAGCELQRTGHVRTVRGS